MRESPPAPRLSILIATLDEESTIEACLRRVLAVYPSDCEVIVVNGGRDRTGEIVERMAAEHPAIRHVRNADDRGKGHAIRVGVSHARAPVHAQLDADLQFLPEELPRLVAPVLEGRADIALGSRFCRGAVRRPGSTPPVRTLGNRTISLYASALFGQWLSDVQAGMKAWSAEAMRRLGLQSDNYSYEVEIAVKGLARGLRVVDVPVTTEARAGGHSNVRLLRSGLALLRDISMFRLGLK